MIVLGAGARHRTNVIATEVRSPHHRVEQQRMADFYARQAREQEERENGEARERFAESQRQRQGGSKTE